MERIASGYALTEAPVADPEGGVYFSDVLGGGVFHWKPTSGEAECVLPKRRGIGGMALHSDGGLVVSGRDLARVDGEASETLMAGDEGVAGFNDLTVDPDGRVVAGVLRFRPFLGEEPVAGEFVAVRPGGPETVLPNVEWPNGCGFSPDGETFYACDYRRGVVIAAERREGAYAESRVAITSPSGEADGLAVDEHGAIWVALGGDPAVARFLPDGTFDRRVDVPAPFVASLCFGGADLRDLFITTTGNPEDPAAPGGVYATRAPVAGVPIPRVAHFERR